MSDVNFVILGMMDYFLCKTDETVGQLSGKLFSVFVTDIMGDVLQISFIFFKHFCDIFDDVINNFQRLIEGFYVKAF